MEKVLVLGAGGFVGGAILRAIAASADFEAIAGVRTRRPGILAEQRICNAADKRSIAGAVAGVQVVVNAVLGNAATMLAATQHLAETKAPLVVHISSMSVYGNATGLISEDAPLLARSGYGGAKRDCEDLLSTAMAQQRAVILRPGIVYAPAGQQWIGRLGRLLRAGRLGDLGPAGDGRCNLIHADDVGLATLAAIMKPQAAGLAINVSNPDPPRWNAFLTGFARAIGAVPVKRIGSARLCLETLLLAPPLQIAKLAGLRMPEPIPHSLIELFGQDITLDHRKADAVLGFKRTDYPAGLAASARWFVGVTQ